MTDYYFVRVNGHTGHNNPDDRAAYVRDEPPTYPKTYFNHADRCLELGIIRIGWPNSGDLRRSPMQSPLARCHYNFGTLKPHRRDYLLMFRDIPLRSVVLMPDKDQPGNLYIGEITGPYEFDYQPPAHPFECAHHHTVKWDCRRRETHVYSANDCGITIKGGFWRRGFAHLNELRGGERIIRRIETARRRLRG
jgi:hypothetical protein